MPVTNYVWDYENMNALVRKPDGTRATMAYNADLVRWYKEP